MAVITKAGKPDKKDLKQPDDVDWLHAVWMYGEANNIPELAHGVRPSDNMKSYGEMASTWKVDGVPVPTQAQLQALWDAHLSQKSAKMQVASEMMNRLKAMRQMQKKRGAANWGDIIRLAKVLSEAWDNLETVAESGDLNPSDIDGAYQLVKALVDSRPSLTIMFKSRHQAMFGALLGAPTNGAKQQYLLCAQLLVSDLLAASVITDMWGELI